MFQFFITYLIVNNRIFIQQKNEILSLCWYLHILSFKKKNKIYIYNFILFFLVLQKELFLD